MSQRYQKEIEEILEQANVEASEGKESSGRSRRQEQSRLKPAGTPRQRRNASFRITTGKLLLAGVILLPLALIFSLDILAWLGIGLIVAAYVMYFARPRRVGDKRWRGQPIEDDPEQTAFQRFWRWLTRG